MKKFLSFAAFSLLTVFVTLSMVSCGSDDPEDTPDVPTPSPLKDQTFTVEGVSFTMKAVQGGTFTMGSSDEDTEADSDEKPAHSVTLSNFWIGQTEVTQELWEKVMKNNPSYFKGNKLPVESVSWTDCQDFIKELNTKTGKKFRLPTEAEWEYAARGGNKSKGYKYSGGNDLGKVAWYKDNSSSKTHDVGTLAANELGIYDMSGNVWEWCSDLYSDSYDSSSPASNPQGPNTGSGRVDRGGGWGDFAKGCRVASRSYFGPNDLNIGLGLRLVLSE